MRRWLVLSAASVVLLCLGLIVVAVIQPGTLAKRAVRLNGATVVFRIKDANGSLYASAVEQRGWSTGASETVLIGEVDEIGVSNPVIELSEIRKCVLLHVGRGSVEFDMRSKKFQTPSIAP